MKRRYATFAAVLVGVLFVGGAASDLWGQDAAVYPLRNQSRMKIEKDKSECREWATKEMAGDPEAPPLEVAPSDAPKGKKDSAASGQKEKDREQAVQAQRVQQRTSFDKAYRSCLEGRGYRVR
jgi:hypothetical protein